MAGPDGQATGILVHGVDVTEMIAARQSLETRSRLFDTVLSSIADFAYVFDRDGRFRYVNKALLDLWGLDLAQAVGRDFHSSAIRPTRHAAAAPDPRGRRDTGARVADETSYTSPAGKEGFYEYIFMPIFAGDGRTVDAVAGSTRDISARKETERQLAAARAHAEQLGHLKDEFLATLSHELRTPLSAILGWTHVLAQRASNDETTQKALDAITRNARAQAQLIDDMLDLAHRGRQDAPRRRRASTWHVVVGGDRIRRACGRRRGRSSLRTVVSRTVPLRSPATRTASSRSSGTS